MAGAVAVINIKIDGCISSCIWPFWLSERNSFFSALFFFFLCADRWVKMADLNPAISMSTLFTATTLKLELFATPTGAAWCCNISKKVKNTLSLYWCDLMDRIYPGCEISVINKSCSQSFLFVIHDSQINSMKIVHCLYIKKWYKAFGLLLLHVRYFID